MESTPGPSEGGSGAIGAAPTAYAQLGASPTTPGRTLETLRFDNRSLRVLPVNADRSSLNEPQEVSGACFSHAVPTPIANPTLVAASDDVIRTLGIAPTELSRADFAAHFCGNELLRGSEPAAHCYCGHQFGQFAGQLGDGATMYLGELLNPAGERWEIQLKGGGRTHYSRSADGRKVLRSSLREFLCSEANAALGLPTTRAATLVTSDTRVERDVHYTGEPIMERASVVMRVARSFIRFGSFQICLPEDSVTGRAGPSHGMPESKVLGPLIDHVADLLGVPQQQQQQQQQQRRLLAFGEVVRRTAALVAGWQCVGFCHGVLNTDNLSVLGKGTRNMRGPTHL